MLPIVETVWLKGFVIVVNESVSRPPGERGAFERGGGTGEGLYSYICSAADFVTSCAM